MIRRLMGIAALAASAAACESPTVPAAPDTYDFELTVAVDGKPDSAASIVFHWPLGSSIAVYIDAGADPSKRDAMSFALERAIDAWNDAALFDEFRVVEASGPASADVLLRFTDVPLAVTSPDPVRCDVSGGRAVTTFCPTPDLTRLQVFPGTGGGGRVRMIVTLFSGEAVDRERLSELVTHEIGHVLGLWQHPDPLEFPGSVMLSNPPSPLLSAADRATIRALYRMPTDVGL